MEHIDLKPIITTYTGIKFNLLEPEFNITDIAHALSNTCRYAGHCQGFYSVAEHSVLVSCLVEQLHLGDPMTGLLHDGHEAYLSDVPSPFKQLLPDWTKIDEALEEKLYKHFDLPFPREDGIKEADVLAFFIEKDFLFETHASNSTFTALKYPEMQGRADLLMLQGWEIISMYPEDAEILFMERYERLQEQAREN